MVIKHHVCDVDTIWYHVVCIVDHGLYDRHIHVGVPSGIDHGLYDGIVMKCVPYFYYVVENGSKTRISSSISPYKMKYHIDKEILVISDSNELHDKICSQNFLWQLSEKMDPKFYEKLIKIDIPPPMKNLKNGESARGKWTMKEN
ncbi:hypothetical protein PFMG_00976 [Plasmodium falciparum IGH-CR14]|uniref:Uncharacterized protein n=1 Tax=Plasmodium falciparum IGH-CR14 TaxID=580059 RepID=A0A0L1I531_PLAFA|nr:hypothetical protein PFMG_00976 [Plasmodium falciparum IGH-CR14]